MLAVGGLALGITLAIGSTARPGSIPLTLTEPTNASPSQVAVGHCLKTLPADGRISTVVVVPCASGHKAQVIAKHLFDADARTGAQPTYARMRSEILQICHAVQLTEPPDDLSFTAWLPTAESWRTGDRTGVCLARASTLTTTLLP